MSAFHIAAVKSGKVEQTPKGHVGIPGGLSLVEIHTVVDEEGHIILDTDVENILQRGDLQKIRIRVVRTVHRIIQAQKSLLFLKQPKEQPILVLLIYDCLLHQWFLLS